MDVLKVSAKSNPNSVAGALANVLRDHGTAELQAIGAGAINQSVKAVAIARGFVAPSGIDLVCIPAFTDILIDNEERTAIKFIVEPRWFNSWYPLVLRSYVTLFSSSNYGVFSNFL